MSTDKKLHKLWQDVNKGHTSRRSFLQNAAALGLSAPVASALLGGSASAASFTGEKSPFRAMQNGGVELTIGMIEEPDTLEPHNLTAAAAGLVGYVVTPGLVWWDFELGVSPMLAESWEQSDDGLTWTFTLRPDLTFHNGKTLDAHEVVRNFERIIDPEQSFLAPDYELVESIEATDDLTVVFTLSEAYAPFLAVLSHRASITDVDAIDANKPIGAGPFRIVEWTRGSGIQMEAFEGYWGEGLPVASKVNWNFYGDDDARMLNLRAGDIDIVYSVPYSQIDQVVSDGYAVVEPITALDHSYLAFNCAEGPFSDVRVRKAVAHAIDKELIVEASLWGHGTATNTPFPPESPWFVETPDYEYDPERARSLMEEAGYGDGIQLDMPIAGQGYFPGVAELIQPDLAQIGIDLRIVTAEWATYWPEIYLKTQYDITIMGYSARVDADQTFYPRYHSQGVHNATKYSNARVDELLEAARRETVHEVRKEMYDEVQQILVDELPWLWLFLPDVAMGWKPGVTGFRQHAANHVYLTETTMD